MEEAGVPWIVVMPPKTGPAFEIVRLAREHGGKSPRTDGAAAAAINTAIKCAIKGGFLWTKDDAREIDRLIGSKCGQYNVGLSYGLAVAEHNESACKSMEAARGWGPWLWPFQSPDGTAPGRIAAGCGVVLDGLRWDVTTMEAERIILCHYGDAAEKSRTPKRRLTLDRTQVAALLAATTPAPEPEIPALGPRYQAVYPESNERRYQACSCADSDAEACWSCRSARDADVDTRKARTRAAKSDGRWALSRGMTLATVGASAEEVVAATPPPGRNGPRPLAASWGGSIQTDRPAR